MSRWSRIVSWLSCVLVSTSLIGCATFNAAFGSKMLKATAANPVVEVVCLWQPGEGNDPDGIPCKGFMGQIMFLSRKSSQPVEVDGNVRIYLFDDQGTLEEQAKPLREFDFSPGSWGIHLTQTSYGPTYTVFIPYVRRGVSNAACSLRLRYTPKDPKTGDRIFSEFTNMHLNGPKKTVSGPEATPITKDDAHHGAVDSMVGSLLRTTTIASGPDTKSMQATPTAKKEPIPNPNVNQVQLATHQVPAAPAADSPDADRIRRLEAMVEKLLEQQATLARNPAPLPRKPPEPLPTEVDEQQPKLLETDGNLKPSRRMKIRRNDEDVSLRSSPARRVRHPLDDDDPLPSRTSDDNE